MTSLSIVFRGHYHPSTSRSIAIFKWSVIRCILRLRHTFLIDWLRSLCHFRLRRGFEGRVNVLLRRWIILRWIIFRTCYTLLLEFELARAMIFVNHMLFVFLEGTLCVNTSKRGRLRHRPIKGVIQVCCAQIRRAKLPCVEEPIVIWRVVQFVLDFLICALFALIEQSGRISASPISPQDEGMSIQSFFLLSESVLRYVSPHRGILKVFFHVGFVSLARKWFLIGATTRRNRTSRR